MLICSTTYGGCGYIGDDFWSPPYSPVSEPEDDVDLVICPKCKQDHAFQITEENIHSLTNAENFELARTMLDKEKITV